jgi:osmotically-inducible protein OsmY
MRILTALVLTACVAALAGCNPYMAAVSAVSQTYEVATDERSLSTQASDTEIEADIKARLVASPVQGTGSLSVLCRRGVVVLSGVVPPGSPAGDAAVQIASARSGVRRVETFFVASEPSEASDLEISGKIKAAFIADSNVIADQVTARVYNGHVVLVGVVSSWQQAQQFVDDARSVGGVVSVRSYIQVAGS